MKITRTKIVYTVFCAAPLLLAMSCESVAGAASSEEAAQSGAAVGGAIGTAVGGPAGGALGTQIGAGLGALAFTVLGLIKGKQVLAASAEKKEEAVAAKVAAKLSPQPPAAAG